MVMLETLKRYLGNGWVEFDTTCTYASADDPTYTMYVAGNATTYLWAGMRFKCTQTTDRMFIITAVGSYDSGNNRTPITLYGGTDFDLANATISNPYYSPVKCPYGFPMNPDKWSVQTTYTSNGEQLNPVVYTWYNIGSVNLSVPIGTWELWYKCEGHHYRNSSPSYCSIYSTLSTANNTQSDSDFTCHGFSRDVLNHSATLTTKKTVELTSKTSYYLNFKTDQENTAGINHYGGLTKTIVRAVCAYL